MDATPVRNNPEGGKRKRGADNGRDEAHKRQNQAGKPEVTLQSPTPEADGAKQVLKPVVEKFFLMDSSSYKFISKDLLESHLISHIVAVGVSLPETRRGDRTYRELHTQNPDDGVSPEQYGAVNEYVKEAIEGATGLLVYGNFKKPGCASFARKVLRRHFGYNFDAAYESIARVAPDRQQWPRSPE